jgi:hypothetical protein
LECCTHVSDPELFPYCLWYLFLCLGYHTVSWASPFRLGRHCEYQIHVIYMTLIC